MSDDLRKSNKKRSKESGKKTRAAARSRPSLGKSLSKPSLAARQKLTSPGGAPAKTKDRPTTTTVGTTAATTAGKKTKAKRSKHGQRGIERLSGVDLSALGIHDPVEEAHRRERQRTFRACLVIGAAVAVALTVLLGVAVTLALRYRAQPSTQSSGCPTAACAEYAALLTNAIDERNRPCDNYYQHICSIEMSRLKNDISTVHRIRRDSFNNVTTRLRNMSVPDQGQSPLQKAAAYLQVCESVIRGSNVQEVREALRKGGITWPDHVDPSASFIDGIFYMSAKLHTTAIIRVEVSVSNNARESPAVTFSLDKEFITTLEMLKRHRMTKRILGHFKLTYATFAPTPKLAKDKGRSDQLFKDLIEMSSKFGASTSYENTMADSMPLELHPRNIPTVAPSTDYDTWNAALRRHFNQSFDNIPSVTIKRPKYFRAVFMLHAAFGDTKTLDFFGWLSIQSLIHFTSPKLLSSYYYSSEEQAFSAHRSHCLAQTHAAFRSALNAHIWMVVPKATLQDVHETATDVWRAFAELLGEENRTLVGSSKPPPKDPYQEALFLYRTMSKPEKVNAFYASVPAMKMKPLYNYVAVKDAMYGLMRDPEFRLMNQEWKIEDASTLRGYSLVPPELEFPWLGPGRPYALALAGLGVRMAATLYFQSVARLANASETTAANFRCLAPSAKDEDGVGADIPAAAAALRVVWRTWEAARRANATPAINLGPVPSDAAVFAFHCWFSCGLRPYHEMICNLPLMHSSDFARVYGCEEGSKMNPKTKCAIRV
ncbi:EEF1AKMT4-ECE2 readthrough transcript protein-like isoform X4 [Dermacentor albipictus]|uniref:EEF1AKMT4-ECE2 readthrough transcript protein-like isoform X4 n=1 Tax=Dermacentor albipictus TaxID=60249 RepID=UPI0038FCF794